MSALLGDIVSNSENQAQGVYSLAASVPDDKRSVAEALAQELDFMSRTLTDLKEHIAEHGAVEWYENGRQQHWRESPAMKAYTAMIPRYAALYKQLCGLLPEGIADQGDDLDEWLRNN